MGGILPPVSLFDEDQKRERQNVLKLGILISSRIASVGVELSSVASRDYISGLAAGKRNNIKSICRWVQPIGQGD
jgi:hypothetical protein